MAGRRVSPRRVVAGAAKRSADIVRADLPWRTRRDLLALEARYDAWLAKRVVGRGAAGARKGGAVRIGDVTMQVSADDLRVDYTTLFSKVVAATFDTDYRDALVLDVGAHRGYLAAHAFHGGAWRVWSYEPESRNHAILEATRDASGVGAERWEVHRVAVAAAAGTAELHLSTKSRSHSLLADPATDGAVEQVDVVAFGDVVRRAVATAAGRPIVAKLNVEGAAGGIIVDTPAATWQAVAEVLFDYEPSTPEPLDDLRARLEESGLHEVDRHGRKYRFARAERGAPA